MAKDDRTVIVKARKSDDGKPENPLMVIQYLGQSYVLEKAWLQKLEERNNYDEEKSRGIRRKTWCSPDLTALIMPTTRKSS